VPVSWLPVTQIDEPPAGQNSRRFYPEASLAQLAASIREHGLLQPLCVRPNGSRYQLVFGVRRLRAAMRAGLHEVPCTVRVADDDRAFLLNALENLHRQQLSGTERVRAIERLAATGLGVREISRRTGFNPSTISRWLRIDDCAELKSALEAGTLDISRAKILVEAPRAALTELIEQAPGLSVADLRARVASLKSKSKSKSKSKPVSGPSRAQVDNVHWLREALRCLRAARHADDPVLLDDIRSEIKRLAGPAGDASAAARVGWVELLPRASRALPV
jgi:ParB family chromosome partitioning protein